MDKPIALAKVATELNLGHTTIVEFLQSKGFTLENKPNAKVLPEMYDILNKEFSKSKAIKEQADAITIGHRQNSDEKEEPKVEVAPPVVETPPVVKAPVVETPPVVEVKTPVVETPPVVEVSPPPVVETPVAKVETPKVEVVAPPVVEQEAPKAPKPVVEKPAVEEDASKLRGLKQLGKIDLDALNKPKPKKQEAPAPKVEAKKEEAPVAPPVVEQKVEEVPVVEQVVAPEIIAPVVELPIDIADPESNMMRAETPQLKGLKILGKINLPVKEVKKKKEEPVKGGSKESDEESRKRRKRKKISTGEAPKDAPKPGNTPATSGNDTPKDKPAASPNTNNNSNNNAPSHGKGKKGEKDKGDYKELTQAEIDAKISKTLDLASKGKKKKKFGQDRRSRDERKEQLRQSEGEDGGIPVLKVTEFVSVSELAGLLDITVGEVISTCMSVGLMVSINQRLEADVIELIAGEFGHEVEFVSAEDDREVEQEIVDDPADLRPRAPIVTVMGHVDHGKTSLLDFIRKANVMGGEAGGITQHIGAYEVSVGDHGKITFLDTPGHEAFTAMRARGAKVTDIAVIVVAADDSIMPQTREAISHAQAAGVPMVFAINKIDKEGAQPEKIKEQLAQMNILVEDWGGEYQSQDISAKKGMNVDLLLEKILIQAEMLELSANPNRPAVATVIEASLEKGKGYVAKALIQAGTLHIGDSIVSGSHSGKVKAMYNDRGVRIKEAGPSRPVMIVGLDGAPQAGEKVKVCASDQEARQLANKRAQIQREMEIRSKKRITLKDIGRRLALGSFKQLNIIVKGDVDGSVEALSDSILKLSTETVATHIVHKAVGQITESDVLLASASDAIIVGFQVRPSPNAKRLAEQEGVEIETYSVIYDALDEIRSAIEGMLEPTKEEKVICNIEVREVFKIGKVGTVAGCYVTDGKVTRNTYIRVIRDGIVVFPVKEGQRGEISTLKRFKDDMKEVREGYECGITTNFNDIQQGDVIEGYEIIEVKQTLDKR